MVVYLRDVAASFALRPHIRFGTEVATTDWDEAHQLWTLVTTNGERYRAKILATAVGQLNRPKRPNIEGLNDFLGKVFHSAQWPDGLDVTGQRVAILGTGASAMQIVPAIVDRVEQLAIFQRSPQWIAPNSDYFRPVGTTYTN